MVTFTYINMNNYQILGLNPSATIDDIKRAYRKAAMKNHPDRGGDKDRFQSIKEAYEQLNSLYKQRLQAIKASEEIFDEIIEEETNEDLSLKVKINLEQSYVGGEIDVQYDLLSGKPQSRILIIPKGVKNNEVVRYKRLGDDSLLHAPRGDLLVQYQIEPHERFVRRKDDLCLILQIDPIEAMIGAAKTIENIDGSVLSVEVQPGSIPNQEIVIKKKGFVNISSTSVGDCVIIVEVVIPKILNPELKEKLMDLNNLIKEKGEI
jgi:DnaJ-class molecular chaperone